MKILLINGSPRLGGNTEILLNEAKKGAEEVGLSCELIQLGKLNIKPCMGDFACLRPGHEGECHIKDDMHKIYDKLQICEGIIFGTPVYLWDMTSQMLIFLHRSIAAMFHKPSAIAGKVGGLIVISGRRGNQNVANVFNMFFIAAQMMTIDAVYGYAESKGEIRKDIHSMKSSYELGRCIALMIKEGRKIELPDEYRYKFLPTFVCEKYDIPLSPGGYFKPKGAQRA